MAKPKEKLTNFNNNNILIFLLNFYRKRSIDGNNSESEDKPNSTDNPGSNSPPKRPKTNCWPQFLRDCTILWQQSSMAISRKKNTKIPWKPWDIPNLFEFMADDISTNGPRRINSYVKNNPYLKQMDNSWQQHYLFDDTKTKSGILRPWYLVTKKQNVIPIN